MFEIRASGIPADKIVVGKPGSVQDTTNGGFIDPATLSTCVSQAVESGWDAGVMVYQVSACWLTVTHSPTPLMLSPEQYPHANATWLAAVKKDSFKE